MIEECEDCRKALLKFDEVLHRNMNKVTVTSGTREVIMDDPALRDVTKRMLALEIQADEEFADATLDAIISLHKLLEAIEKCKLEGDYK